MGGIDYFDIIKRSAEICWRRKFLWWFGFLSALTGYSANKLFSFSNIRSSETLKDKTFIKGIVEQWHGYPIGETAILVMTIFILIAFWAIRIVCQTGIITSVHDILSHRNSGFKSGFQKGARFLKKLFILHLTIFFYLLFVFLIISVPLAILLQLKTYTWLFILGVPALVFLFFLAVTAFFVNQYAMYYLVLTKISLRSSLEKALFVFRRNFSSSLLFLLIMTTNAIFFGGVMISMSIFFSYFFNYFNSFVSSLASPSFLNFFSIFKLTIEAAILIFFQGIYEVFFQASWFLFFYQIASIKKNEAVNEAATAEVQHKLLKGEEA